MSRIVPFIATLAVLAGPAWAQVSNPSRIELKDEGVSKGRIFSLDCVGAELVCAATGGVATITHTPVLVPFALGGTGLTTAADDTTLVSSGSAWAAAALANCVDTGGNHLNYTAASNAFSCGTSAGTPAGVATLAGNNIFATGNQFNNFVLFTNSGAIGPWLTTGAFISLDTGALALLGVVPGLTPNAPVLGVSTVSSSFHIAERDDISYNATNGPCGTVRCTDPTLIVRSHNQTPADYSGHAAYGLAGKTVKALTESVATAVVTIPIAVSLGTVGKIFYSVFAADATDQQIRSGSVSYAGVNKAGTETCSINGVDGAFSANPIETQDGSGAGAMSAGTLAYTWTASNSPTNGCQFLLNAVSSLTQTTLVIQYQVIQTGPGEVLPQ